MSPAAGSSLPPLLADGNVLIALAVTDHVHYHAVNRWFADVQPQLATCPITEGTLLRFLIRSQVSTAAAMITLDSIRHQPWHHFWPDSIPYGAEMLRGVIGHRQVTDSYLVDLAASNSTKLATLDKGLATFRPDQTELIPTD